MSAKAGVRPHGVVTVAGLRTLRALEPPSDVERHFSGRENQIRAAVVIQTIVYSFSDWTDGNDVLEGDDIIEHAHRHRFRDRDAAMDALNSHCLYGRKGRETVSDGFTAVRGFAFHAVDSRKSEQPGHSPFHVVHRYLSDHDRHILHAWG